MLKYNLFTKIKLYSEVLFNGYSNGDKFNIIKSLNSENKYQYGNLLETQRQRRRKNTKAGNIVSRKQKIVPQIDLEDVSGNISEDEHNVKISKTESAKTLIKKSKVNTKKAIIVEKNQENTSHERQTELTNDEFIFNSHFPINDENFPLINPEKNIYLSSKNIVKNVLHYSFKDPIVKYCLSFPSVSKIIEDTMSEKNKQLLSKWRLNMIKEMGEEKFNRHNEGLRMVINSFSRNTWYPRVYQTQPKCFYKIKKKKSVKARGQEFHSAVLHTVLGKEVNDCSEVTRKALESLSWMLEHVSHPVAVESVIAHPKLAYKGIPDCVALFRNTPVVIDWKLSDKPKKDLKDTYDAPVQITAYIGALNHDPNYQWSVNHGLVAVAYTNGDPCDVFLLAPKHCQIYWRHWLQRLDKFKARSHLHIEHDIDEKSLQL